MLSSTSTSVRSRLAPNPQTTAPTPSPFARCRLHSGAESDGSAAVSPRSEAPAQHHVAGLGGEEA
eukprot:scaffold3506_cov63-Phaeocystis_antarctica.AAC.3